MISKRDDFEVIYPDGGGAVIFRIRRPWPVPLPILSIEYDYDEEDAALQPVDQAVPVVLHHEGDQIINTLTCPRDP